MPIFVSFHFAIFSYVNQYVAQFTKNKSFARALEKQYACRGKTRLNEHTDTEKWTRRGWESVIKSRTATESTHELDIIYWFRVQRWYRILRFFLLPILEKRKVKSRKKDWKFYCRKLLHSFGSTVRSVVEVRNLFKLLVRFGGRDCDQRVDELDRWVVFQLQFPLWIKLNAISMNGEKFPIRCVHSHFYFRFRVERADSVKILLQLNIRGMVFELRWAWITNGTTPVSPIRSSMVESTADTRNRKFISIRLCVESVSQARVHLLWHDLIRVFAASFACQWDWFIAQRPSLTCSTSPHCHSRCGIWCASDCECNRNRWQQQKLISDMRPRRQRIKAPIFVMVKPTVSQH